MHNLLLPAEVNIGHLLVRDMLCAGASGFGTPVALAAPMLASLGHAPIPTVTCLLIMNTLATQFGGCRGGKKVLPFSLPALD
jgi:hypothetical protein